MLVTGYAARYDRRKEKMLTLLNFLREETYSDFETLNMLFQFNVPRPLHRLLAAMVRDGLIEKYVFEAPAGRIALWGITVDGIAVSLPADAPVYPSRFEPLRVSGWSMQHHLDNQRARLMLEAKKATGWIHGDRKTFFAQFKGIKHRPDGVITLATGRRIAVETERNLKTPARYFEITKSHLFAISEDYWSRVFYLVPDAQKKIALLRMFGDCKLNDAQRSRFNFFTYEELRVL